MYTLFDLLAMVLVIYSVWVMMNKLTRRLSKIPEEVREEIGSYFVDSAPILEEDNRKLPKLDDNTADYIRSGLSVCPLFSVIVIIFLFIPFTSYAGFWLGCILSLFFQPRWSDLDVNQHVNNVKYIGWILEVIFFYWTLILISFSSLSLFIWPITCGARLESCQS